MPGQPAGAPVAPNGPRDHERRSRAARAAEGHDDHAPGDAEYETRTQGQNRRRHEQHGRGNVREAKQKGAPQTSALHPFKKRSDRDSAERGGAPPSLPDAKRMTPKERNPTEQAATASPIPRWLSACIV